MQKHGLGTSGPRICALSFDCKEQELPNLSIPLCCLKNRPRCLVSTANGMVETARSMSTSSEIVIIGGGPAGLAAATILGRKGVRVIVLDRQSLPADKVCGEGIMPPGVSILSEIGALPLISSEDAHPFAGISYRTTRGAQAKADFESGPGRGIRRTALSRALRTLSSALPSVTLEEGVRVTGVRRTSGGMVVSSSQRPPITCRLVIGADGLRSRVRRWAGLEGRPPQRSRFGVRQHFHVAPWSRYVEIYCGPSLEAYVTPCGPTNVGVAILWEPSRCPQARPGEELFASLLASLPELQERLAGAQAANAPRSTGPFEQRTRHRTSEGLCLLGDASGYLDPCTGEGLTLAFKQAHALGNCLPEALGQFRKGSVPRSALLPYESDWRRITRSYFLCTRFMLACQRHPGTFDRLLNFAAGRPDVLRHFTSYNMGTAPLLPAPRRMARWLFQTDIANAENS